MLALRVLVLFSEPTVVKISIPHHVAGKKKFLFRGRAGRKGSKFTNASHWGKDFGKGVLLNYLHET